MTADWWQSVGSFKSFPWCKMPIIRVLFAVTATLGLFRNIVKKNPRNSGTFSVPYQSIHNPYSVVLSYFKNTLHRIFKRILLHTLQHTDCFQAISYPSMYAGTLTNLLLENLSDFVKQPVLSQLWQIIVSLDALRFLIMRTYWNQQCVIHAVLPHYDQGLPPWCHPFVSEELN